MELAGRYEAALSVEVARLDDARFHVTVHDGPDFTPSGDETADIQRLTEIITARIEEIVREDPAQWLWIHRRWPS